MSKETTICPKCGCTWPAVICGEPECAMKVDPETTDSDSLGWHPEEKTPDDIIVTPEMIGAGMRAFTEVLQRHNIDGLLSLGCFWNGLGEAYRAMEFARAKAT